MNHSRALIKWRQESDGPAVGSHQNSNVAGNRKSRLDLKGVADIFWCQWRQLSFLHPMGIDIFFTCDDVLTALPKMTRIEPSTQIQFGAYGAYPRRTTYHGL